MPDSFKIFSTRLFLSPLKWYELNSCENKYKKQGKIIQFQKFLVIDRLKI